MSLFTYVPISLSCIWYTTWKQTFLLLTTFDRHWNVIIVLPIASGPDIWRSAWLISWGRYILSTITSSSSASVRSDSACKYVAFSFEPSFQWCMLNPRIYCNVNTDLLAEGLGSRSTYRILCTCISNFILIHPENRLPSMKPSESDVNCSGIVDI